MLRRSERIGSYLAPPALLTALVLALVLLLFASAGAQVAGYNQFAQQVLQKALSGAEVTERERLLLMMQPQELTRISATWESPGCRKLLQDAIQMRRNIYNRALARFTAGPAQDVQAVIALGSWAIGLNTGDMDVLMKMSQEKAAEFNQLLSEEITKVFNQESDDIVRQFLHAGTTFTVETLEIYVSTFEDFGSQQFIKTYTAAMDMAMSGNVSGATELIKSQADEIIRKNLRAQSWAAAHTEYYPGVSGQDFVRRYFNTQGKARVWIMDSSGPLTEVENGLNVTSLSPKLIEAWGLSVNQLSGSYDFPVIANEYMEWLTRTGRGAREQAKGLVRSMKSRPGREQFYNLLTEEEKRAFSCAKVLEGIKRDETAAIDGWMRRFGFDDASFCRVGENVLWKLLKYSNEVSIKDIEGTVTEALKQAALAKKGNKLAEMQSELLRIKDYMASHEQLAGLSKLDKETLERLAKEMPSIKGLQFCEQWQALYELMAVGSERGADDVLLMTRRLVQIAVSQGRMAPEDGVQMLEALRRGGRLTAEAEQIVAVVRRELSELAAVRAVTTEAETLFDCQRILQMWSKNPSQLVLSEEVQALVNELARMSDISLLRLGFKDSEIALLKQIHKARLEGMIPPKLAAKLKANSPEHWESSLKALIVFGGAIALYQTIRAVNDPSIHDDELDRVIAEAMYSIFPTIGLMLEGVPLAVDAMLAGYDVDTKGFETAVALSVLEIAGLTGPVGGAVAMVALGSYATITVYDALAAAEQDRRFVTALYNAVDDKATMAALKKQGGGTLSFDVNGVSVVPNVGNRSADMHHSPAFVDMYTPKGDVRLDTGTEKEFTLTVREALRDYAKRNVWANNKDLLLWETAVRKYFPDINLDDVESWKLGEVSAQAATVSGREFKVGMHFVHRYINTRNMLTEATIRHLKSRVANMDATIGASDQWAQQLKVIERKLTMEDRIIPNVKNEVESFWAWALTAAMSSATRIEQVASIWKKSLKTYGEAAKLYGEWSKVFDSAGLTILPANELFGLSGVESEDQPKIEKVRLEYVLANRQVRTEFREAKGGPVDLNDPFDKDAWGRLLSLHLRIFQSTVTETTTARMETLENDVRKVIEEIREHYKKGAAAELAGVIELDPSQPAVNQKFAATLNITQGKIPAGTQIQWSTTGGLTLEKAQGLTANLVAQDDGQVIALVKDGKTIKKFIAEVAVTPGAKPPEALAGYEASLELSDPNPPVNQQITATLTIRKGQLPPGAQIQWSTTGGLTLEKVQDRTATLVPQANGQVIARVKDGKTIKKFIAEVAVKPGAKPPEAPAGYEASIELSDPNPPVNQQITATLVFTKGELPKDVAIQWWGTGGFAPDKGSGQQASFTARENGQIIAALVQNKKIIRVFSVKVTVTGGQEPLVPEISTDVPPVDAPKVKKPDDRTGVGPGGTKPGDKTGVVPEGTTPGGKTVKGTGTRSDCGPFKFSGSAVDLWSGGNTEKGFRMDRKKAEKPKPNQNYVTAVLTIGVISSSDSFPKETILPELEKELKEDPMGGVPSSWNTGVDPWTKQGVTAFAIDDFQGGLIDFGLWFRRNWSNVDSRGNSYFGWNGHGYVTKGKCSLSISYKIYGNGGPEDTDPVYLRSQAEAAHAEIMAILGTLRIDPNGTITKTPYTGRKLDGSDMMKVQLAPPSLGKVRVGDSINLQAVVENAWPVDLPFKYTWTGNYEGSGPTVKVKTTKPGKYPVSVAVDGAQGPAGSASLEYTVSEPITVKLEKIKPAGNSVIIGGPASFKATVMAGTSKASGDFVIRWEPDKDRVAKFKDRETTGVEATNEIKFMSPGNYLVYADALEKIGGALQTAGKSEQIPIQAINPTWEMSFEPLQPRVGEPIKAKVQAPGVTAEGMKAMNFEWRFPDNAKQEGAEQKDGVATFYLKDTKPALIQCIVRLDGESLGRRGKTITAQGYQVTATVLEPMGPAPMKWDPVKGGLVPDPKAIAIHQNVRVKAAITPEPPKKPVRWSWKANPDSHIQSGEGSSEIMVNRSQLGTGEITVVAEDGDGLILGTAKATFNVTNDQGVVSKELRDAALKKAAEGKLDEAIALMEQAVKLDPVSTANAALLKKLKTDKATITKQLEKTNALISQGKMVEAAKELAVAKGVNAKYPPVLEAEKRLAAGQLAQAKELVSQGKLDEGIALVDEILKLDPKQTEAAALAAKWKAEKQTVMQQVASVNQLIPGGKFPEAEKALSEAQKLHPKYAPVVEAEKLLKEAKGKQFGEKIAQAKELVSQGKLDEGIVLVDEILKLDPKHAEAAALAAKWKAEKQTVMQQVASVKQLIPGGKFTEAEKALSEAQKLHPKYAPVVEAEKLLKEAKEKKEKIAKAKELVSQGKLDEGIALVDEVLKLDPKQTEASALAAKWKSEKQTVMKHVDSIKKLITAKRIVDAEKELPEAQKLHPQYAPVVEVEKLLKAAKAGGAADTKKTAIARDLAQAKKLLEKNQLDAAAEIAQAIRNEDPSNREAEDLLQQIKEARLKDSKAKALFAEAKKLEQNKDYKKALEKYQEANSLVPSGEVQKKIAELEKIVQTDTQAKALLIEGDRHEQEGKLQEAIQKYQQSVALAPNPEIEKKIVQLQEKLRKQEEDRATAIRLRSAGDTLQQQDKLKEAIAKFQESQNYLPDPNLAEHVKVLEKRLADKKKIAVSLRAAGDALVQQDKLKEAIAKFQESQNYLPDPNLAEHVKDLEKRLADKKKIAVSLRAAGDALVQQNKLKEAIAKFQESQNYLPDPNLAEHVKDLEKQLKAAQTPTIPAAAPTRFTKDKDGVISDSTTGLQWYVGARHINWNEAKAWTESLNVAGGGWRMPTIPELKALYQKGAAINIVAKGANFNWNMDPIFQSAGVYIWSGQMNGSGAAGRFDFDSGHEDWSYLNHYFDDRAFAVRSRSGPSKIDTHPVQTPAPPPPVTTRFTKDKEGVISDRDTGLQWYVGPDRNTNWNEAKAWTERLTAAGGGWRMPSFPELGALFQKGASPNNMDPIFQITGFYVWSREMNENGGARILEFHNGGGFSPALAYANGRAFAVRSHPSSDVRAQTVKTRFTKDKSGVISDSATGLQWYVGPDQGMKWDQAKAWTESLTVAGGGWRMPTIPELKTLYQKGVSPYNNNIDPIFQSTGRWVYSGQMRGYLVEGSNIADAYNFVDGQVDGYNANPRKNLLRPFAVRSRSGTTKIDAHPAQPKAAQTPPPPPAVTTRFTKDNNGVISDRDTGLQWYVGPDVGDVTWNKAKAWTESLTVAGGGWRMPTIPELKTLYQLGKGTNQNVPDVFQSTGSWAWSGQTRGSQEALNFSFSRGQEGWWGTYSKSNRAFAVRSRQKSDVKAPPSPTRFTKDKDRVISDSKTGLQWYVGPDRFINWNQAKAWTESLTAAGGGWRMPTMSELKTLHQKGASPNNLDPVFQITSPAVWSGQLTGKLTPSGVPFARVFFFDTGSETSYFPVTPGAQIQRAFAVRARR
jgi:hypothetical protein